MNIVSRVRAGWLELLIGGLFTVLSLTGVGRIGWHSTLADVLAFGAAIVALRWLRPGVALAIAVTLAVPFLDPQFLGFSLYIGLLPALTAIRRGRLDLAFVLSVMNFGVGIWALILSRPVAGLTAAEVGTSVFAWLTVQLLVWGAGLAIRSAERSAAARVAESFRAQQASLAAELHDSVCRDLTLLSRYADLAVEGGGASVEDLELMAARARAANQALREATRLLANGGAGESAAPIPLKVAFTAGVRELRRAGFAVEDVLQGPIDLSPDVDLVAGRILAEALHNACKHGTTEAPCLVVVEQTESSLDIAVINAAGRRGEAPRVPGLGLPGMKARAASVGGKVHSRGVKESWVCEASLPLTPA